jgi:hypothetical protein
MDKPVAPQEPQDQDQEPVRGKAEELPEKQMQALAALYKTAKQQQGLLEQMLVQQKAQTEWIVSIGQGLFPDNERFPSRQSVKVNDVNMPFSALVGFLLKIDFASIPAAIIFYIVPVTLFFSLFSLLLFAGGVLGALGG